MAAQYATRHNLRDPLLHYGIATRDQKSKDPAVLIDLGPDLQRRDFLLRVKFHGDDGPDDDAHWMSLHVTRDQGAWMYVGVATSSAHEGTRHWRLNIGKESDPARIRWFFGKCLKVRICAQRAFLVCK